MPLGSLRNDESRDHGIYALQKALRQAEGSVLQEWAAIRKLFPEPMLAALSRPEAGPLSQDLGEQAATHLKNTAQTTAYLAAVERLSAAYEEIKQMPHHQDKAPWVVFYRVLADRLRPPAGEAIYGPIAFGILRHRPAHQHMPDSAFERVYHKIDRDFDEAISLLAA